MNIERAAANYSFTLASQRFLLGRGSFELLPNLSCFIHGFVRYSISGNELGAIAQYLELSPTCCATSPDGEVYAAGFDDGSIRLWSTNDWKELKPLIGHTSSIRAISFSDDCSLVLSASDDETTKIWQIDGTEYSVFRNYYAGAQLPESSLAMYLDTDNNKLYELSGQNLHVFRLSTGELDKTISFGNENLFVLFQVAPTLAYQYKNPSWLGKTGNITTGVLMDNFSNQLVIIDEEKVCRVDIEDCPSLASIDMVAGAQQLVATGGNRLLVIDITSGKVVKSVELSGMKFNIVKHLNSKGQVLVGAIDGTLYISDLANLSLNNKLPRHSATITSIAVDKSETFVATGAVDGSIKVSKMSDLLQSIVISNNRPLKSLCFVGSERLLGCLSDGTIAIWNVDTGEKTFTVADGCESIFPNPVACSDDTRFLAFAGASGLNVCDIESTPESQSTESGFTRLSDLQLSKTSRMFQVSPDLHKVKANAAEESSRWYGAAYHRALQIKSGDDSVIARYYLNLAVAKLGNSILPDIARDILMTSSSMKIDAADLDEIREIARVSIEEFVNSTEYKPVPDDALHLLKQAIELQPRQNLFSLLSDAYFTRKQFTEGFNALYEQYSKFAHEENPLHGYNFALLISEGLGRCIQWHSKSSVDEVYSKLSPAILAVLEKPRVPELDAKYEVDIANAAWEFLDAESEDLDVTAEMIQSGEIMTSREWLVHDITQFPRTTLFELLTLACDQHPSKWNWSVKGAFYYRYKRYDEAIDALEKASQLPSETPSDEEADTNSLDQIVNLGFLALAHQAAGHNENANQYHNQFQELLKAEDKPDADWLNDFEIEVNAAFETVEAVAE